MDFGIVIALKEEFREFMALLPATPITERDPQTGQYGYVFEHPVSRRRCVVTLIGEMNPEPAALQTERLLSHWAPRAVVMLGIAAGIHPDVRVGDVVIASQVDNYLATAKAQGGSTPDSFEFALGGRVFHADFNFVTQVRNFEFFAREVFSRWQQDCAQVLAELVPEEAVRMALLQKRLVRAAPDMLDAHLASDSVVAAAQQFTQWLRSKRDRNLKAIDMESAGFMEAAVKRMEPARTLVIRGISDYGDERKSDFDAVGEGALRRYAMRNATRLLWALLEAGVLSETAGSGARPSPAPAQPEKSPPDGNDRARQTPFIGIPGGSLREGFKGREQALEALHALLRETGKVALTSGTVGPVYAHGGGGMGKSRLAIEYAHRYRHEYPGGVFCAYVAERAPQAIFAEFARGLLAEKAPAKEDEAALAFVRELEDAAKGPRLIIFDDVQADSRESLARRFSDSMQVQGHPLWPIPYTHVSLLITTRMGEIEREIEGAKSFFVKRLDAEAALELLLERARPREFSLAEHPEARRLASEDLGGHPLAIRLAGAYLGRVKQISLAEYRHLLHEQGLVERLEVAADEVGHTIRDHERSIAATYELSWRQLKPTRKVDKLALQVLSIAAFLAPSIPMDSGLLRRLLKSLGMIADLERLGRSLARLATDLSLLDVADKEVIIHPLIADYVRWSLGKERRKQTHEKIVHGVNELFPGVSHECWKITQPNADAGWEWLSPQREAHVVAVWEGSHGLKVWGRVYLSGGLGDLETMRGKWQEAKVLYQEGIKIAEALARARPSDPTAQHDLSVGYEKFGDVARAEGKLEDAHSAYKKGLDIRAELARDAPGDQEGQRGLAVMLSKVCEVLEAQGEWEKALAGYKQASKVHEQLMSADPANPEWQRDLSVVQEKIGSLLIGQGKLAEAREACERALQISEQLLLREPDNREWQHDLALDLRNLGIVLKKQHHLGEAQAALEKSLQVAEQLVAKDPSNQQWQTTLALCCYEVASVLIARNERTKAQGIVSRARDVLMKLAVTSRLTHVQQHQWLPAIEAMLLELEK